MARGFVLLDVVPGKETTVFDALARVPAVLARRKLATRAKSSYEILALVEAETDPDLERVFLNHIRPISGVKSVQPIGIEFTMTGHLQKEMEEMEREVKRRLEP